MPIGSFTVIPHIALHLARNAPARVLDVGIGFGMYGAVVREWVDLGVQPWKTHLVGIEVHEPYRNPVWDLYDEIFIGTVQAFLAARRDPFQSIILGDVIEHMDKPDGRALLTSLQQIVAPGGDLFVATPAVFFEQNAVYGNPYECHRSLWTAEDFMPFGFRTVLTGREPQVAINPTVLVHWQRPRLTASD